jgi:MazG family protein
MTDTATSIERLLKIMRRLRDPEHGCPWDRAQDFATIAPYTIEEAYEVAEAISDRDFAELRLELGDLLFQVVFHAQMAEEAGYFSFQDVVNAISDKMERRHPHVFGSGHIRDAAAQTIAWEEQKAAERSAKGKDGPVSVLDGITKGLPALVRAIKLQNRAARVGFDWPETHMVIDKIQEEMAELAEELVKRGKSGDGNDHRILDEFGDLLFVYANLARHLKVDPEDALRHANRKFERRFRRIETLLEAQGKHPQDCTLEELDGLWNEVKREEKAVP